jgi:hypothetical protein
VKLHVTARSRSFLALFKSSCLPLCFAHDFNLTLPSLTTQRHNNQHRHDPHHIAFSNMLADCLPGAKVTVRVNGTPLTEHATENGVLTATTFVEAIAGAEFDVALNWRDHSTYRDPEDRIRFCVHVDGEWVRAPIITAHSPFFRNKIVEGPQETRNGVTTVKRLTFAQHASSRQQIYHLSEHN